MFCFIYTYTFVLSLCKAFLYLWLMLGPFAVNGLEIVEGGAVVVDEAALWLQVTLNSYISQYEFDPTQRGFILKKLA